MGREAIAVQVMRQSINHRGTESTEKIKKMREENDFVKRKVINQH